MIMLIKTKSQKELLEVLKDVPTQTQGTQQIEIRKQENILNAEEILYQNKHLWRYYAVLNGTILMYVDSTTKEIHS